MTIDFIIYYLLRSSSQNFGSTYPKQVINSDENTYIELMVPRLQIDFMQALGQTMS